MPLSIASLTKHPLVFKGRDHGQHREVSQRLAFGQPALDKACVGGVPPTGVLSLKALPGFSELQLLRNILRNKTKSQKRLVWLTQDYLLNDNWLLKSGYHQQSWIVNATSAADTLWACEQSVRSQACCCVVMYIAEISQKAARRLQVLASQYECLVIIVQSRGAKAEVLPVNIDMALGYHEEQWLVQLHRVKGGWPQKDIVIDHPLPATNQAIITAFSLFGSGRPAVLHDVS